MKKIYKLFTVGLLALSVQSGKSQCVTPTLVTATPSVICAGATTSLNAIALGSSINWYTVPVAGVPIGSSLSGGNYTVNPTANVTYYAESFLTGVQTYSYTGAIQNYTVPAGVNQVTITAKGAQGGNAPPLTGGLGASMSGIFTVTPGQVFSILVGQTPGANDNGGGGGSFVVLNGPNTPYIIAGGGGGAAGPCCSTQQPGMPGVITTSATIGSTAGCVSGTAGINGNGGGAGTAEASGGGGGLLTNGGIGSLPNNNGKSFLNGGAGGIGQKGNPSVTSIGGFGGGGGPHDNGGWTYGSGGGGGGYSGGGGNCGQAQWGSGGGGGSYNIGTSQVNTSGTNSGHGLITITQASCFSASRTAVTVSVNPIPTITVNSGTICNGNAFTIVPSGASTYTIQGGNAIVTPTTSTNYTVTGTSAAGCIASAFATSSVIVNSSPLPTVTVNNGTICAGNSFTMIPSGANTYTFQGGNAVVSPTANASYTVVGTNTAGCVSQTFATSNVSVNGTPTVVATSNTTLICTGESATLTASGANTYTWNTSSTTASIVISPTVTTSYTVNGTDANGCTNSSVISQTVSLCTGISLINGVDSKLIAIYPNPSNGEYNIELNANSKIIVVNALGQEVLNKTLPAGKQKLDIQNQSKGIYFIKVKQVDNEQVIKIIKE